MSINTFIFDFGGVLVGWDPYRLYQKRFPGMSLQETEEFFQEIDFMNWNLQQDKGRSFDEGVDKLSKRFPKYDALIQAYHRYWTDTISGPITGTVEILKRAKDIGYAAYGLTNFSTEKYQVIREKFDFIQLLDDVVVSGDVKLVKPDPRIFELMLDHIGHKAEECVYIDDSLPNIETARRLGFHSIHFQSPEQLAKELDRLNLLSERQHKLESR